MKGRDARGWKRMMTMCMTAVATAVGMSGCAVCDQGDLVQHAADPEVTLLYSCDSARSGELDDPEVVWPHTSRTLTTAVNEVLFFKIKTDYAPAGAGGHDELFYVLGAESGQTGKAVIRGRFEKSQTADPALVELESGWLWVSSDPPPNWTGPVVAGLNAPTAPPAEPSANTWLSWSIITLIRTRWNWAGSEATEFIARITPSQDVVYAIDELGQDKATHSWDTPLGTKQTIDVPINYHSSRGNSTNPGPINPTPPGSSDDRFVKYVECRVDAITANPSSGSECGTQHTTCINASSEN